MKQITTSFDAYDSPELETREVTALRLLGRMRGYPAQYLETIQSVDVDGNAVSYDKAIGERYTLTDDGSKYHDEILGVIR